MQADTAGQVLTALPNLETLILIEMPKLRSLSTGSVLGPDETGPGNLNQLLHFSPGGTARLCSYISSIHQDPM
ncbi:hypothetical protein V6N12_016116 [Hibiscus sabdariffa]|uniref:Uncharacterized protein n=1 Tax=Hibiscus sabdariffa TaxID=183260 RepID=A0ABR2C8S9_9ROSI